MSTLKLQHLFGILLSTFFIITFAQQADAAPKAKSKATQSGKERLVLMPLRLDEADQKLQGAMETALVEGLQRQYEVLSGEQVARKAREIFQKESRNTAKKECDETRCLQGITEAFQSELLAIASVTKQDGGYFLALSIRNLYDNIDVYSKSLTCRGCDSFQAVDKIKELVGPPTSVVNTPVAEPPPPKITATDPDSITWAEAQKGNTADDFQVYLDAYPKGKYIAFAKAKLKKLKEAEQAAAEQQEQQAWDTAQQENSEASYSRYLKGYPAGRFAGFAQIRLNKLKSDQAYKEESANKTATVTSDSISSKESGNIPRIGITVGEISKEQRQNLGIAGGVLVREVNSTKMPAALQRDDIILAVGNKEIDSVEQLNGLIKVIPAGRNIALLIQRSETSAYVAIKLD